MKKYKRTNERLIVLLLLGLFSLNFPVLALFNKDVLILGIPSLYLYLFLFWLLFIGLMAFIMEQGRG